MVTWLPSLLALVLVAVEARRQSLRHWRREERRALLARAAVVTVGVPAVFEWNVGMDVAFHMMSTDVDYARRTHRPWPFEWVKGHVVKINYATGKLWVADVR